MGIKCEKASNWLDEMVAKQADTPELEGSASMRDCLKCKKSDLVRFADQILSGSGSPSAIEVREGLRIQVSDAGAANGTYVGATVQRHAPGIGRIDFRKEDNPTTHLITWMPRLGKGIFLPGWCIVE